MAGMDEVLERLVGDAEFRKALTEDPQTALAGYDLSREDLEVLSAQLDEGTGGEHAVEQRTSKSAMMGLITGILGAGDASGSQDGPANAESGPAVSGDDTHYDGKPIARYHLEQAWPKDQNPDEIAPPAPETESSDYSLWRNNFGTADQASADDASTTPKLAESIADGTHLGNEDSGDPDGLTSAEAAPAAEDTAQQSGDPNQPVIIGSIFNGEAGSDVSATDLPDLAGSEEGSGQPQESDLDFITERAHESADGGWYITSPSITVSGGYDEGPGTSDPDDPAGFIQVGDAQEAQENSAGKFKIDIVGSDADAPSDVSGGEDAQQPMGPPQSAHVAISLGDGSTMEQDGAAGEGSEGTASGGEGGTDDPAAAGGHEVEYEVEEGEK